MSDSVTPWIAVCQASLSFTISCSLIKLMSIEVTMPSNHLILCHTLFFLPSIFPSIRVFSNELTLQIKWQKYWSFSFSISPSNEYSGLIFFRIDWFDLRAVQGPSSPAPQFESINCLFVCLFFTTSLIFTKAQEIVSSFLKSCLDPPSRGNRWKFQLRFCSA